VLLLQYLAQEMIDSRKSGHPLGRCRVSGSRMDVYLRDKCCLWDKAV
jgi:hypothetical protein